MGSILLYGCHVAMGEVGTALLEQLHAQTNAIIHASSQAIGNGNWHLDTSVATGKDKTEPALALYSERLTHYTATLNLNVASTSSDEQYAFLSLPPPSFSSRFDEDRLTWLGDADQALFKTSFNFPVDINLKTYDPLVAAANGDAIGADLYAKLTAAQTLVLQIAQTIQGAASDQVLAFMKSEAADPYYISYRSLGFLQSKADDALYKQLKNQVSSGQPVNLADPAQIQAIFSTTITDLQAAIPTINLQSVTNSLTTIAQVISASTQSILNAASQPSQTAILEIAKARQVTQKDVAPALEAAMAGSRSLAEVVTDNTGASLTAKIQATVVALPPIAAKDSFTVGQHQLLRGNVLDNNGNGFDLDLDSTQVTVSGPQSWFFEGNYYSDRIDSSIRIFSGALVTMNADGFFTYNPNDRFDTLQPGQTATDSFTYTIRDASGLYDTGTVLLTILGTAAPVATASVLATGLTTAELKPTQTGQHGRQGERESGSRQSDQIHGSKHGDTLNGKAGNDRLWGQAGDDLIDGGKGKDKSNGGQGQDAIYGGAGDDLAVGGQGNDNLFGGSQRDRLRGSGGNDLIVGNADQDTLTGGGGNDTFSFITIKDGIDTITDFFTGSDVIDISKIVAAAKIPLANSSEKNQGNWTSVR